MNLPTITATNHGAFYYPARLFFIASFLSCQAMPDTDLSEQGSSVKTSTITEPIGNEQRCGVEGWKKTEADPHGEMRGIYQEVYSVFQPALAHVVSLYDENRKDKVVPEVKNAAAKTIVRRTRQWLLNIMGMRARPIHPVAFYAVIKDFETARDFNWSKYSNFNSSSMNCSTREENDTKCLGLFQINLFIEGMADSQETTTVSGEMTELCGDSGLNLLGQKGGLDVCATLYWWLIPYGTGKCDQMPEDTSANKLNPCTATRPQSGRSPAPVYPWTTDTFAYAHCDTYVQWNQLGMYGIGDPWRALYERRSHNSGRAITKKHPCMKPKSMGNRPHIDFLGYEHCAARHYLSKFAPPEGLEKSGQAFQDLEKGLQKLSGNASEGIDAWVTRNASGAFTIKEFTPGKTLNTGAKEGHGQELLRATVADFARDIDLYPWWYEGWWNNKDGE